MGLVEDFLGVFVSLMFQFSPTVETREETFTEF